MWNYLTNFFYNFMGGNNNRRLMERSLFLWILTAAGFLLLDVVIEKSRIGEIGLLVRYPEFIILMKAASIFTFIEVSLIWIRIAIQPKIDVQEAHQKALETPLSAAIVHFTTTAQWFLRILIFLKLAELL